MFSALGAPTFPRPPHARPRDQGLTRPVAGVQGARHRLLPGAVASVARELASGIRADFAVAAPRALTCFEEDFEACVAHLRPPVTHRRVVPNDFGEKPVLKLMFCALIRATERWRGLRFTEFELRQLAALRKELDEEYEPRCRRRPRSTQPRFSSKNAPYRCRSRSATRPGSPEPLKAVA
jgi:hypothetical protein